MRKNNNWRHGEAVPGAVSREYRAWQAMKYRCSPTSQKNRKWYFDRGIKVCAAWRKSFPAFLADMGRCPEGYQLERKRNSEGYSAENCIWASGKANCRNKRNNRILRHKGQSKTVTEWAEALNVPVPTLFSRVYMGWPVARILSNSQTG